MSKKYTVRLSSGVEDSRSRKDAAIKVGEESGLSFQVFSPSGALVHESVVEEPIVEEPIVEEPVVEEPVVEDTVETKFSLSQYKRKIAALLLKAERTDNQHERDAFTAKAEKMMIRMGITVAELEAAGDVKPEDIVEAHRDWRGNYSIAMLPFTGLVASGFGNITVLQSNISAMHRISYIVGHKSDVEQFTTLLDSLALQSLTALGEWQKKHRAERKHLTDMQKYIQHRSFLIGYAETVSARLSEMRQEEEVQASPGAALVLASKKEKVDDWVQETYQPKDAKGGIKYGSSVAAAHGREAGAKALIGSGEIETNTGELS